MNEWMKIRVLNRVTLRTASCVTRLLWIRINTTTKPIYTDTESGLPATLNRPIDVYFSDIAIQLWDCRNIPRRFVT